MRSRDPRRRGPGGSPRAGRRRHPTHEGAARAPSSAASPARRTSSSARRAWSAAERHAMDVVHRGKRGVRRDGERRTAYRGRVTSRSARTASARARALPVRAVVGFPTATATVVWERHEAKRPRAAARQWPEEARRTGREEPPGLARAHAVRSHRPVRDSSSLAFPRRGAPARRSTIRRRIVAFMYRGVAGALVAHTPRRGRGSPSRSGGGRSPPRRRARPRQAPTLARRRRSPGARLPGAALVDASACPGAEQTCERWLDPPPASASAARRTGRASAGVRACPCAASTCTGAPEDAPAARGRVFHRGARGVRRGGPAACREDEWQLACEGEDAPCRTASSGTRRRATSTRRTSGVEQGLRDLACPSTPCRAARAVRHPPPDRQRHPVDRDPKARPARVVLRGGW